MWKWFFNKFIIKVREQVVADLELNLPARSYEEHLDDFLTMLIRMAGTLLAAVFLILFFAASYVPRLTTAPIHFAHLDDRIMLTGWALCTSPEEARLFDANAWLLAILFLVFLAAALYRQFLMPRTQPPTQAS